MATAVEPKTTRTLEPELRFLLPGVGWNGYDALLTMLGDKHVRITFDRGDAELMSPSRQHEEFAELLGEIILVVTAELRLPRLALGTTTWRKRAGERGLEADKCFYLASTPRIHGRRTDIDLTLDPPPDLAIEVEISRSALDRMGIYAALGVPEVWRFDGDSLTIHQLQPDGGYLAVDASPGLPELTAEDAARWVRAGAAAEDQSEWSRNLRDWVRETLLPRSLNRRGT